MAAIFYISSFNYIVCIKPTLDRTNLMFNIKLEVLYNYACITMVLLCPIYIIPLKINMAATQAIFVNTM